MSFGEHQHTYWISVYTCKCFDVFWVFSVKVETYGDIISGWSFHIHCVCSFFLFAFNADNLISGVTDEQINRGVVEGGVGKLMWF